MKTAAMTFNALSKKRISTVDLSKFSEHLGPDLPVVTTDRIGKYRLQSFLKGKLGANYKNHPIGKMALEHFDSELKKSQYMSR